MFSITPPRRSAGARSPLTPTLYGPPLVHRTREQSGRDPPCAAAVKLDGDAASLAEHLDLVLEPVVGLRFVNVLFAFVMTVPQPE